MRVSVPKWTEGESCLLGVETGLTPVLHLKASKGGRRRAVPPAAVPGGQRTPRPPAQQSHDPVVCMLPFLPRELISFQGVIHGVFHLMKGHHGV